MKKIFIILFLAIIAVFVSVKLLTGNNSITKSSSILAPLTEQFSPPTPTPMLFAEMTIPHLRTRVFESQLGERQKVSENSSYSSYITSYESEGLKINGLLTIPSGTPPTGGKWPAIVFVHGYIPPAQYKTTGNYASFVDYLARRGFVVFKIDLRGHDKSEGEAGGGYYSADYVIDTLNARAALASSDFVKPDGIGLWGHSMAGNVVMRATVAKTDIAAVVIWAGAGYTYKDLQDYRISDSSYRPPPPDSERQRKRQQLRDAHGEFNEQSAFWRQVAVTDYLSDIEGAVQLHHAVDDNVVSIEYSRNLSKLLENASIEHELFEYPSGGHNLTGSSFSSAMQRTVDFYTMHL